jgi:hypothetical protein
MKKDNIRKLKDNFVGKGDVKGFLFNILLRKDDVALYEVIDNNRKHYEVIKIKLCNSIYDKDYDLLELYPTANQFGTNAWCYNDLETAIDNFVEKTK